MGKSLLDNVSVISERQNSFQKLCSCFDSIIIFFLCRFIFHTASMFKFCTEVRPFSFVCLFLFVCLMYVYYVLFHMKNMILLLRYGLRILPHDPVTVSIITNKSMEARKPNRLNIIAKHRLRSYMIDLIDCWCFNATFNNISAISGRPVLVVEEARVPGENHRP